MYDWFLVKQVPVYFRCLNIWLKSNKVVKCIAFVQTGRSQMLQSERSVKFREMSLSGFDCIMFFCESLVLQSHDTVWVLFDLTWEINEYMISFCSEDISRQPLSSGLTSTSTSHRSHAYTSSEYLSQPRSTLLARDSLLSGTGISKSGSHATWQAGVPKEKGKKRGRCFWLFIFFILLVILVLTVVIWNMDPAFSSFVLPSSFKMTNWTFLREVWLWLFTESGLIVIGTIF